MRSCADSLVCRQYANGKGWKDLVGISRSRVRLFAQKPERLGKGKYYDLLGSAVWIDQFSSLLLKGRTLTAKKVGGPEPREQLVLDSVPEDYVQTALRENAGCSSCCSKKTSRVRNSAGVLARNQSADFNSATKTSTSFSVVSQAHISRQPPWPMKV